MTRVEMTRFNLEQAENPIESREITRENIERYVEGCEELAVRLDTVIEKALEAGKRPVILIPSRGAVPIFLLARRFFNELHGEGSYLADQNARYFPESVFNYLEGNPNQKPDERTAVDVILYPFTADVSLESTDDETIAKELRNSCARSVMQIVKGINYGRHDFEWYKFLMSKLAENPKDPKYLSPQAIVNSLESFPHSSDSQIILIDTVISGRAANDITSAFKTLGHTVVPILAVDTVKGGKFESRRQAEILGTLETIGHLLPENGPFLKFPLLTEDKGSALLGVVALNFINFNEPGVFRRVSKMFESDFRPQSCVWTLPPMPARASYLNNFRSFVNTAWSCRNGSPKPCSDEQIASLKDRSKPLTATHPIPTYSEINELIPIERATGLKESASHIVSVRLPHEQAEQWIMEFSSQIGYSAP